MATESAINPHRQQWFVLTCNPRSGRSRAVATEIQAAVDAFNRGEAQQHPPMEFFAPTLVRVTASDRTPVRRELPLACQYVFMRASAVQLSEFRRECQLINPVANLTASEASGATSYLTLPDATMAIFQRVAAAFRHEIPVFRPGEIDLTRADEIEIVGGDFNGLSGRLLRQQGASGGTVVFEIGNRYMASVAHVDPRYIRILRFAPGRKNAYELIDNFVKRRLRPAIEAYTASGLWPLEALAPEAVQLAGFVQRYGEARIESAKMRPKLAALLAACFAMLGDGARAMEQSALAKEELEAVTNPTTLTLIHSWLALAERNKAHLEKANTAAAALRGIDARRLTPIQSRALADLTLLNANLND